MGTNLVGQSAGTALPIVNLRPGSEAEPQADVALETSERVVAVFRGHRIPEPPQERIESVDARIREHAPGHEITLYRISGSRPPGIGLTLSDLDQPHRRGPFTANGIADRAPAGPEAVLMPHGQYATRTIRRPVMASHSAAVLARGFSQRQCSPPARASRARAWSNVRRRGQDDGIHVFSDIRNRPPHPGRAEGASKGLRTARFRIDCRNQLALRRDLDGRSVQVVGDRSAPDHGEPKRPRRGSEPRHPSRECHALRSRGLPAGGGCAPRAATT